MKLVRAWLSFGPTSATGDEMAYKANAPLIDTVVPVHGDINADGTWTERAAQPFALELPALAAMYGQRYVPSMNSGHGDNWDEIVAVLADTDLWPIAAANLVTIATTTAFDAPWDGVTYDTVTGGLAFTQLHQQFIAVLSAAVLAAGLSFEVTTGADVVGKTQFDFAALAELADEIESNSYLYADDTFAPLWWSRSGIAEALGAGVQPEHLYLGIGNFGQYWPVTGEAAWSEVTHADVMQLVADAGGSIEWHDEYGGLQVSLSRATIGVGHAWFMDRQGVQERLDLCDSSSLAGIMLFRPETGDSEVWLAIADWKRGRRQATRLHLVAAQEEEEE